MKHITITEFNKKVEMEAAFPCVLMVWKLLKPKHWHTRLFLKNTLRLANLKIVNS